MSTTDMVIMLNGEDYDKMKSYEKEAAKLSETVDQLKRLIIAKERAIEEQQIEAVKREMDIAHLLNLFKKLSKGGRVEYVDCFSPSVSGSIYEDLEVFRPEEHIDRQAVQKDIWFKYSGQEEIVEVLLEKYQSQELLLKELQNNNRDKEERMKMADTELLKALSAELGTPFTTLAILTRHIKDLEASKRNSKLQLDEYKTMLKDTKLTVETLTDKLKQCALTQRTLVDKIRTQEKTILTTKNSVEKPKDNNSLYTLKLMVDQYIRQIENGLKNVEGLQPQEKTKVLQAQSKILIDYIAKAVAK